MTEVIAVRRFWWADDPDHKLSVSIGKPAPDGEDFNAYYCPIQTTGFGNDGHVQAIYGVDACQALELAMKHVQYRVWDINQESGGRLRWEFGDDQRIPDDWRLKPTRLELDHRLTCENSHTFELQSGLSRDRRTNHVLIHCPTCKIRVGGLGPDYPEEWLPPNLPQCNEE
jgi:hypothetical protein